jgi:hypothetical protein
MANGQLIYIHLSSILLLFLRQLNQLLIFHHYIGFISFVDGLKDVIATIQSIQKLIKLLDKYQNDNAFEILYNINSLCIY